MKIENVSTGKVTITEDLYKKIQETVDKAVDDNLEDGFIYSFKAFGELENLQDTLLCDSEDLVLSKKDYLFTVNSNDMKKIEEQIEMGRFFLANMIFHVKKDSDETDSIKQYQQKYNFYSSKIHVFPTVVVIDPKTKNFEIVIYETPYRIGDFRRKEDPIYIRVPGNFDIPMDKYDQYIQENNSKHSNKGL